MSDPDKEAAFEELRKQVSNDAWDSYVGLFEICLGKGRVSEGDRLSYMEDMIRRHLQLMEAPCDPSQHWPHLAALRSTKEEQEHLPEDEVVRYGNYRERAANLHNQLVSREIRAQEGDRITQKDFTYPRREAEKLAAIAVHDCTYYMDCALPKEITDLVEHLLLRPTYFSYRSPRHNETVWTKDLEAETLMFSSKRDYKYYHAAQYLAQHRQASDRKVAKKVGVDHKTIAKWKTEEHFIDYQECYLRELERRNS